MFQSDNLTEARYSKGGLQPGQRYNVTVIAMSHGEPSTLSVPVIFNTGKNVNFKRLSSEAKSGFL